MSHSSYSLRRNGNDQFGSIDSAEKRQRLDSQQASSVVYLGNVPPDWTDQIIGSVVAGSGKIVDIRARLDPTGRSKNFCFIEYADPNEAARALPLLGEISLGPKRKLRVELSKEGLRSTKAVSEKPILQLDRNFLPYYVQVPEAMRNEGPSSTPEPNFTNNYNNNQNFPQSGGSSVPPQSTIKKENALVPEILSKASNYLPKFNPSTFKAEDKISQNLQGIPPVQLIELLSTLKNLLLSNNIASAQQVFNMAPNIPVNVVQALVLMGLVDVKILTAGIQQQQQQQQQQSFSQSPQPVFNTHTSTPEPSSIQPSHPQLAVDPRWPTLPPQTAAKLARLDPNEAAMISQVLTLSPTDIAKLPNEQIQVIQNIRSQYL